MSDEVRLRRRLIRIQKYGILINIILPHSIRQLVMRIQKVGSMNLRCGMLHRSI